MHTFFTTLIAVAVVALQAFTVAILTTWALKGKFASWVAQNASFLLRITFFGAVIGSLVYEYVLLYPPCLLCWYQRLAIFSIAILSLTSDIRKSGLLRFQTILLSSIGLVIAVFHNYIDIFPSSGLDVCGAGPSCLARYVYEFGYITIPMMSLTILLFGLVVTLIAKRYPQTPLVTLTK